MMNAQKTGHQITFTFAFDTNPKAIKTVNKFQAFFINFFSVLFCQGPLAIKYTEKNNGTKITYWMKRSSAMEWIRHYGEDSTVKTIKKGKNLVAAMHATYAKRLKLDPTPTQIDKAKAQHAPRPKPQTPQDQMGADNSERDHKPDGPSSTSETTNPTPTTTDRKESQVIPLASKDQVDATIKLKQNIAETTKPAPATELSQQLQTPPQTESPKQVDPTSLSRPTFPINPKKNKASAPSYKQDNQEPKEKVNPGDIQAMPLFDASIPNPKTVEPKKALQTMAPHNNSSQPDILSDQDLHRYERDVQNMGNIPAMIKLGHHYLALNRSRATYTDENEEKAMKYFKMATKKRAEADLQIAAMYINSPIYATNVNLCEQHLKRAAKQNSVEAMIKLGTAYKEGTFDNHTFVVPQLAEALKYFKRAVKTATNEDIKKRCQDEIYHLNYRLNPPEDTQVVLS